MIIGENSEQCGRNRLLGLEGSRLENGNGDVNPSTRARARLSGNADHHHRSVKSPSPNVYSHYGDKFTLTSILANITLQVRVHKIKSVLARFLANIQAVFFFQSSGLSSAYVGSAKATVLLYCGR